jgi:UDP-glucuronate decarboxylase
MESVVMMNSHLTRDAHDVVATLGSLNERFSGKSILLTGAAGFLGAQFCHYFCTLNDSGLLQERCRLTAYDNFIRGTPDWMAELGARADVAFSQADVVRHNDYPPVDFIIHAASIASPTYYRKYPLETMDANVIGLRRLLEHAAAHPIEGMLCFSTSEIYGDPDPANIPTPEEYRGNVSCTGPRACYDESKRFGETLAVTFWRTRGVPVKTVRPFNNYGPGLGLGDKRVLPDFFTNVLEGRDIVLLSDGRATRTFCYVADAIDGYVRALLSDSHGEAFNIGADSPEISMRDLAQLVIATSGKPLRVSYAVSSDPAYLTDNPQRRCPSLEKARRVLGYEPRISLEDGLARSWAYYRDSFTKGADASVTAQER